MATFTCCSKGGHTVRAGQLANTRVTSTRLGPSKRLLASAWPSLGSAFLVWLLEPAHCCFPARDGLEWHVDTETPAFSSTIAIDATTNITLLRRERHQLLFNSQGSFEREIVEVGGTCSANRHM